VIVENDRRRAEAVANLTQILRKARVKARSNVIVRDPPERPITEIIAEESGGADLVLMGLRPPSDDESGEFVSRVSAMIAGLGTVLMVRASTRFGGSSVLFEEDE
jgi:hypothetical protein